MAVVDVYNAKAEKLRQRELSDEIFSVPVKSSVLHEVVTAQMAAWRAGTASVKRRSDVRGSTRKLFRQKGTGRARRGDIKSPLLRGGGVVFGPSPKSWAQKMPKKKRALALKMALSAKLRDAELMVIDEFAFDTPKTRRFVEVLAALKVDSALIVIDQPNDNLDLSSRNVPGVKLLTTQGLNVYDILKYHHLIMLEASVAAVERRLLS